MLKNRKEVSPNLFPSGSTVLDRGGVKRACLHCRLKRDFIFALSGSSPNKEPFRFLSLGEEQDDRGDGFLQHWKRFV